jgi:hypothetical protein
MFAALAANDYRGAALHAKSAAAWVALGGMAQAAAASLRVEGPRQEGSGAPTVGSSSTAGAQGTPATEPHTAAYAPGASANPTPSPPASNLWWAGIPDPFTSAAQTAANTERVLAAAGREPLAEAVGRSVAAALRQTGAQRAEPVNVEVRLEGSFGALARSPDFQKTVHYANHQGQQLNGANATPRPPSST